MKQPCFDGLAVRTDRGHQSVGARSQLRPKHHCNRTLQIDQLFFSQGTMSTVADEDRIISVTNAPIIVPRSGLSSFSIPDKNCLWSFNGSTALSMV